MKNSIELKDLFFGKIDAKNEILYETPDEYKRFCDSFLIPEQIDVDSALQGEIFYILGLKGTGKTAALRYLSIEAKENSSEIEFILFKTDIHEETKTTLAHSAANFSIITQNQKSIKFIDYEMFWIWLLMSKIIETQNKTRKEFFAQDHAGRVLSNLIALGTEDNPEKWYSFLIPSSLKKGSISINAKAIEDLAELGIKFDFERDDKTRKMSFKKLCAQVEAIIPFLTSGNDSLYLFIDELELAVDNKRRNRDALLIRDLIIVIEKLNKVFMKNGVNIKIISAIRTEIISAVASLGKEINKPLSDFGVKITWNQYGGSITDHPLLKILIKRIATASKFDISSEEQVAKLWNEFFPERVQNIDTANHIVNISWRKPRDIIRLLNVGQKLFPKEHSFSHRVFDGISKEYAQESWTELSEELKIIYKSDEIDIIRKMVSFGSQQFTYADVLERLEKLRAINKGVNEFLEKHEPHETLEHLYRLGIIGNRYKHNENRFFFENNDAFSPYDRMVIHGGLVALFKYQPESVRVFIAQPQISKAR